MKEKSLYWLLVCDCEIIFQGSWSECIKKFNSFNNPFSMKLLKVTYEDEFK